MNAGAGKLAGYRLGFTLIELLVVMALIAILVAISLPMVSGVNDQARIATCESRLTQVGVALRLYTEDHGKMPANLEALLDGRYVEQPETLRCCRTGNLYYYRLQPPTAEPASTTAACVDPDTPAGRRPHRHHSLLVLLRRHGGTDILQGIR